MQLFFCKLCVILEISQSYKVGLPFLVFLLHRLSVAVGSCSECGFTRMFVIALFRWIESAYFPVSLWDFLNAQFQTIWYPRTIRNNWSLTKNCLTLKSSFLSYLQLHLQSSSFRVTSLLQVYGCFKRNIKPLQVGLIYYQRFSFCLYFGKLS